MKMSFFWKIVPVAAFAAFALVACDSGSSSDSDAAESSSSAAAQSSGSSSSGMESSGSVAESSSSIAARSSSDVSSSSSVAASSSSVAKSSSSVAACTNTYGTNTVTDCRDGRSYKTVTIGTQMWMAENLNYADSAAMPNLMGNSWCYGNRADSCSKYGRLYTWTAAMNIASSYRTASAGAEIKTPQQGACPAGWHVPTDAEWTTLETAVGGSDSAGTKLKSASGWDYYNGANGNGTDSYGFSALPAGYRYYSGAFYYAGNFAYFWSATKYGASYVRLRYLGYNYTYMLSYGYDKDYAFSVRCVQD